jgi:hypothetical protein
MLQDKGDLENTKGPLLMLERAAGALYTPADHLKIGRYTDHRRRSPRYRYVVA